MYGPQVFQTSYPYTFSPFTLKAKDAKGKSDPGPCLH